MTFHLQLDGSQVDTPEEVLALVDSFTSELDALGVTFSGSYSGAGGTRTWSESRPSGEAATGSDSGAAPAAESAPAPEEAPAVSTETPPAVENPPAEAPPAE